MPRKISEFFQPISKTSISQNVKSEATIPKIRKCRVVLADINQQNLKRQHQIFENIKIEPEKEYLGVLEPNIVKTEPDVAKKIKIEDENNSKMVKQENIEWKVPNKSRKIEQISTGLRNVKKNPKTMQKSPQNPSEPALQPRTINCKFCAHRSSSYKTHHTHIKKVHQDKLYTCDQCYSTCSTLVGIRSHMTHKHLNQKIKLFFCDYCGKEFKSKARLYYHVLTHRPRIECGICHMKLKHESIKEHLRDFHVDQRMFSCKMCTKTFKADKDLKKHEKVHLKKFNCQICFRKFRLQYDLNVHVHQFHENPGSFKCEICGMKFNEKVVLKRHKYRHDNKEKKFKCDRCDYASADKQLYKRHLDTHKRKDERIAKLKDPKKCKICFNLLKNDACLAMHMKHSHSGKIYQCDYCGKIFKGKNYFINHMEKHKFKMFSQI